MASSFKRLGDTLRPTPWPWSVDVTFPERADGWFELRAGDADLSLRARLRDARSMPAEVIDGTVVYRGGAAHGGDLLYRTVADGFEDYVSFSEPPANTALRYEVELGTDVASVRLVGNAIELLDRDGTPQLRIANAVARPSGTPSVVVGAPGDQTNGAEHGSAYHYVYDDGAWCPQGAVVVNTTTAAHVGHAVALSIDSTTLIHDVLVGAPDDSTDAFEGGAAYAQSFAVEAGPPCGSNDDCPAGYSCSAGVCCDGPDCGNGSCGDTGAGAGGSGGGTGEGAGGAGQGAGGAGEGASGAGEGRSTGGAATHPGTSVPSPGEDGGCGCRITAISEQRSTLGWLALGLFGLLGLRRRHGVRPLRRPAQQQLP